MIGEPLGLTIPGYSVRAATPDDEAACDALLSRVHDHDRSQEVHNALARGRAGVVERFGRITGYTTGISYSNHSVAETNDDLRRSSAPPTPWVDRLSSSRWRTPTCSGGVSPTGCGSSSS
jgi:hypothetical protein